jgi:hypothetical protein
MKHATTVLGAIAIAACGPAPDDEPELRCSEADVDITPASEPMPGPCFAQTDEAADGTIDLYERWTYHPLGEPSLIEVRRPDGNAVVFRFGHDAQGRLTWRTQEDESGVVSSRWDREYPSADRVIHTDSLPDGTVQGVSEMTLDADGELVSLRSDDDLDGRIDWRTVVERDADGRELATRVEKNLDVWTPWYAWTYEHDGDGYLIETEYDYQRPSTTQHDSVTHHANDAWGQAIVDEHIDLVDDEHSCTYYSYVCDG